MNTTYARRIKRGQVAICTGIKNLINIFALADGIGEKVVNSFQVKLTPIITVEDNRRDELMQTKIRNVNDIMSLIDGIDSVDESTKLDMLIEWLGSYLNQQDIVEILDEMLKAKDKESIEQSVDEAEGNLDNDGGFEMSSGSMPNHFPKDNMDSPVEELESPNGIESNPMTEPPEISNDIDLSEIEGEDLI